jgi:hypothetical protein
LKLHIESTCGQHETHGVSEDAVREFENEYRNGTDAVLSVPDGDEEMTHLITRTALLGSSSGPDDEPEPEEDAEATTSEEEFLPEETEGDAEAVPTTEETGTK